MARHGANVVERGSHAIREGVSDLTYPEVLAFVLSIGDSTLVSNREVG